MADWVPDVLASLRTIVKATWTDITDQTLFTEFQAEQVKVLSIMLGTLRTTSNVAITPPFAVIAYGKARPDMSHGVQKNGLYRVPIEIWRVEKQSIRAGSSNQEAVNARAWALIEAVTAAADTFPSPFDVIEPGEPDSDASNEVNMEILGAGYHWVAACARWNPGLQGGS